MIYDFIFEQVNVSESMLFGYPSRVSNIYEPVVESILQKSFRIDRAKVTISIEKTTLPSRSEMFNAGVRDKILNFNERVRFGSIEKLGERLVYDARYVYNNNIAHLIQHHLAQLGFMKKELGVGPEDVTILFERNAPKLALDVMGVLGYETISTSRQVSCNSIKSNIDSSDFFHLLPYVKYIDFPESNKSFSEKIFISRHGTRRLINESEVNDFLCCLGYEKIYYEDLSHSEQWTIMMNASNIVAIHGAALGVLPFSSYNSGKVGLIELFPSGLVVNSYRKYMAILNGQWVGCRGQVTPEVVRDIDIPGIEKKHAFDDFKISIKSLEEAIMYQSCM